MKSRGHEKVAVSIPAHVLDCARAEVHAGRAPSLSSFVTQALEDKLRGQALADILADWDAESGPPSEEDDAWARRVLGI